MEEDANSVVSESDIEREPWDLENFDIEEDEMKRAEYPRRARGEPRDNNSFFPSESERLELAGFVIPLKHLPRITDGVLEDVLRPSDGMVVDVYKARPLPLRCEECDVECDSYDKFTAHCILPSHKIRLDPSRRFDPRFLCPCYTDPRHWGATFSALSDTCKLEAMSKYKQCMIDWFSASCPTGPNGTTQYAQYGAWSRMKRQAKEVRWNVRGQPDSNFGLSKKQLVRVLKKCTTVAAADAWLDTVLYGFEEEGLTRHALQVVQHGWSNVDIDGSSAWLNFLADMTGLDY